MKEADYLLTAIVALSYRHQMVDFPASWYYTPFGVLVPYPSEKVNLSAAFKPLSHQVIEKCKESKLLKQRSNTLNIKMSYIIVLFEYGLYLI